MLHQSYQRRRCTHAETGFRIDELLHDLDVDLLHVNLLIELWRELSLLQKPQVYIASHDHPVEMRVCAPNVWLRMSNRDFQVRQVSSPEKARRVKYGKTWRHRFC